MNMFEFIKRFIETKKAQRELTTAFKARGRIFKALHSTIQEALVKEAIATGADATMKHFDRAETLYLGTPDPIIDYYRLRSKKFDYLRSHGIEFHD